MTMMTARKTPAVAVAHHHDHHDCAALQDA
jgi:hypothetical protein